MIRVLPNGLPGALVRVNRRAERMLNELGGVRSPEMRKAAGTLARSIRKVLSTPGGGAVASRLGTHAPLGPKGAQARLHAVGGTPSAPGQPPHRQTGALAKSVAVVPSGTGIRVGPKRFTALFLEEGVNAVKGTLRSSRARAGATRQRALHTKRTRNRTSSKKRNLVIAARPFMARALEAVREKMLDVFVTEGRKRLRDWT